jgi:hypothetical protein
MDRWQNRLTAQLCSRCRPGATRSSCRLVTIFQGHYSGRLATNMLFALRTGVASIDPEWLRPIWNATNLLVWTKLRILRVIDVCQGWTDWYPQRNKSTLHHYNTFASCAVHATPSIASGAASRSEPTRSGAAATADLEDRPQPLQSVRALARGIAASEDIVNAEEGHHGRDEEETKRRRQEGPAPNLRLRDQHLDLDAYATAC